MSFRYFFLVFSIIFFSSNDLLAQQGPVDLIATDTVGIPGSEVNIDIKVSGFKDIIAFQASVNWDPTLLTFKEVNSFGIKDFDLEDFGVTAVDQGHLRFIWTPADAIAVSANDGTTLFTVTFEVISDSQSSATIGFIDNISNPAFEMEFANNNYDILNVNTTDGTVNIFGSASELVNVVSTPNTSCNENVINGRLEADVNGNTTDFTFNWSIGTVVKSTPDFTGNIYDRIPAGDYTLQVLDKNNQIFVKNIAAEVLEAPVGTPDMITDIVTACDSYTWIDGNTYTSSNNTATFTLTNSTGCDSIVTLDLTITGSDAVTDVVTACDSYTWIDGINYTSSNNTATFTLTNSTGCDSIVTLDLTITGSDAVTDVVTACASYTWIDGNTYTSNNNTATYTLTNSTGCDSIVTLDLTITDSYAVTDEVTACASYTWIDGNTYTSSNNTATYTLASSTGCDSLVTLDLTITDSDAVTDVVTACDSYTWIDGITYTSSNNTATYKLTNVNGCDSIVTLNLTINKTPDKSVTQDGLILTSNAIGADYQWVDCDNNFSSLPGENSQSFTATENGNYAVIVSYEGCSVTSLCYNTTFVSIPEDGFDSHVVLFPNPSDGNFTIKLGEVFSKINYTVFDMKGDILLKGKKEHSNILPISLNKIKGNYLIIISFDGHEEVLKVVID